ncbi:MAG: hypothetical protein Q4F53_02785 [Nesterenkonia sp.]|nr:hypothetical protein [Nesterenkonia sp.]
MTTPDAPQLPEQVRESLAAAYTRYAEAAASRRPERRALGAEAADLVAALRAKGWPATHLAEICGVSSERLRQIDKQYATGAASQVAEDAPQYSAPARRRPRTVRPHLTREEAAAIRELAPDAARNAGSLPQDSPYRLASDRLTSLVRGHHGRGVIWAELSDATRPWEQWPIPPETLEAVREAERAGEPSPLPPVLRISGLRQRVARHS